MDSDAFTAHLLTGRLNAVLDVTEPGVPPAGSHLAERPAHPAHHSAGSLGRRPAFEPDGRPRREHRPGPVPPRRHGEWPRSAPLVACDVTFLHRAGTGPRRQAPSAAAGHRPFPHRPVRGAPACPQPAPVCSTSPTWRTGPVGAATATRTSSSPPGCVPASTSPCATRWTRAR
ncbi:hypothetical protein [Streptomyces sp. NPDC046942]|uniref:hypothetical protein n=1 Tax=Streptomyces sp. NPDC046942 TaxID=3155137 RepID=UPI0033D67B33